MAETVAVVLGDTLLLSSIALELGRHEGFRVLSIDPNDFDAEQVCKSLAPRIVVAELGNGVLPFVFRLQRQDDQMIFLAVDQRRDHALLISSQEIHAANLHEMIDDVCHRGNITTDTFGG